MVLKYNPNSVSLRPHCTSEQQLSLTPIYLQCLSGTNERDWWDGWFLDEARRMLTLIFIKIQTNTLHFMGFALSSDDLTFIPVSLSLQGSCLSGANAAKPKFLPRFWCHYNAWTPLWFSNTQCCTVYMTIDLIFRTSVVHLTVLL